MFFEEKDKRKEGDRRSHGDRRIGSGERRISQDPGWSGVRDRRKGPTCRRERDDRITGTDKREKE